MSRLAFGIREVSGALGDLGTLLPLALGAIAVGGLAPVPVLIGFGVFYLATAWVYRLPVPVQPMKVIVAILLLGEATAASVAVAGVLIGGVLLVLGSTGFIERLNRLVPQSVLSGLQLGLGISLAIVAFGQIGVSPVFGAVCCLALFGLLMVRRVPAAIVFIAVAALVGHLLVVPTLAIERGDVAAAPWPTLADIRVATAEMLLPQLALTITNAVLLTALVMGDWHGETAARVTPRKLCLTSGIANLFLAPFGALPMCHGAGGAAAHARFGARTGVAPAALGVALILIALVPGGLALLTIVPLAALGALLLVAAIDLAVSRRLFDCRPSCRPVIAVTALVVVLVDPFAGLIAGTAAEILRKVIVRRWFAPQSLD